MSKISMIDLPKSHAAYQAELDAAIAQVVHSGQYIGGAVVQDFEDQLGAYLNAEAVSVGNGTDALQIALMALGIGPGDEVIVPAFTYAASAEVIVLLGATPVWCDVDPVTFNINPESARAVASSSTKAVIAVHLFGQCADIEALESALPNVPIIEDNAQSFGAKFTQGKYKGAFAGTVGAFGTLSFFPTKPLGGLGDGGAVVAKDSSRLERARQIARHGQKRKYEHEVLGVNSRLDPIQAAALSIKLMHLEASLHSKSALAASYFNELSDCKNITLPAKREGSNHVFHQFTLIIGENKRDSLREFLKERGISTMVYYPIPLNQQPAYKHFTARVDLRHSESLSEQVLSIPIHDALSQEEVLLVAKSINEYFEI